MGYTPLLARGLSVERVNSNFPAFHPDPNSVEAYVMGIHLDDQSRSELQAHFRLCESCRTLCEETTSFVHAIRDALIPQR